MRLSQQQMEIVNAPLSSLSVIACAGSGKTKTAVHRLTKVRQDLSLERGYVALLSFSNVAVNTFRQDFSVHAEKFKGKHNYFERVVIETLDSFITSNILRPHSFRTMQCAMVPYLVTGMEPFLENKQYKFWASPKSGKDFPVPSKEINNITIRLNEEGANAFYNNNGILIPVNNWYNVMRKLGQMGGYTHEFGKYWVAKTLLDNTVLLKVIAKRYPQIIIDEAQDIDNLHGIILDLLLNAGVNVSLIGDPNQAIYEFAGADGSYLKNFSTDSSAISLPLSVNRRSIKNIVDISSNISRFKNGHNRETKNEGYGAYYCAYKKGEEKDLIGSFTNKIDDLGLALKESAVLVRSRELKKSLKGTSVSTGQGKTQLLALACIKRDIENDYFESFNLVLNCISVLISDAPKDFKANVLGAVRGDKHYQTRKIIWQFIRTEATGLPSANLHVKRDWHPKLKNNISTLLNQICDIHGFGTVERLGKNLSATKLPDSSFNTIGSLDLEKKKSSVRIDTVHQSKGESLDAVMYIATNDQVKKMIDGTNTEIGRIGYVAVTRARDLFVLAIPEANKNQLASDLERFGFKKW